MPSKTELAEFLDPTVPTGTLTRFGRCPFCKETVRRLGFIVWRTYNGWRVYCHKCGTSRRIKQDGVAAPSAIISAVNGIRSAFNGKDGSIYLPEDFEIGVPNIARAWLRKYGVTDEEISRNRFGYSERMNRLILPVFNGEQLVYWQGRKLDNGPGPKYISMRTKGGGKFFELFKKVPKDKSTKQDCVLVEDIVSAICVRRAGFNSIALLGSYVGDRISLRLQQLGVGRVVVWLDPDKRADSVRFARKLSGLGFNATALVTPTKDPKFFNVVQIRSHLAKGGLKYVEEVCECASAATSGRAQQEPS